MIGGGALSRGSGDGDERAEGEETDGEEDLAEGSSAEGVSGGRADEEVERGLESAWELGEPEMVTVGTRKEDC